MHYLTVFFSTFLKTPHFSPHYFLQYIMYMTICIVIMHVPVSIVAMYVTVSGSNFIFPFLTDRLLHKIDKKTVKDIISSYIKCILPLL